MLSMYKANKGVVSASAKSAIHLCGIYKVLLFQFRRHLCIGATCLPNSNCFASLLAEIFSTLCFDFHIVTPYDVIST